MLKVTNWNNYVKGEANCYGWKMNRIQMKITDSHYLNNFVDYVKTNKDILRDLDRIVLINEDGKAIGIFPKCSEDLNDVLIYLDSIKGTDICTVLLSIGEGTCMFLNSDVIESILAEINSATKMEVRFLLSE